VLSNRHEHPRHVIVGEGAMKESVMKKLLVASSLAASLILLSYASPASATPFGGDLSEFGKYVSSISGKDFSGKKQSYGHVSFGKVDFSWKHDHDKKSKKKKHPRYSKKKKDYEPKPDKEPPVQAIPEPSAALVFATGLVVAGWRRRRV
jgi:hypothetical protein